MEINSNKLEKFCTAIDQNCTKIDQNSINLSGRKYVKIDGEKIYIKNFLRKTFDYISQSAEPGDGEICKAIVLKLRALMDNNKKSFKKIKDWNYLIDKVDQVSVRDLAKGFFTKEDKTMNEPLIKQTFYNSLTSSQIKREKTADKRSGIANFISYKIAGKIAFTTSARPDNITSLEQLSEPYIKELFEKVPFPTSPATLEIDVVSGMDFKWIKSEPEGSYLKNMRASAEILNNRPPITVQDPRGGGRELSIQVKYRISSHPFSDEESSLKWNQAIYSTDNKLDDLRSYDPQIVSMIQEKGDQTEIEQKISIYKQSADPKEKKLGFVLEALDKQKRGISLGREPIPFLYDLYMSELLNRKMHLSCKSGLDRTGLLAIATYGIQKLAEEGVVLDPLSLRDFNTSDENVKKFRKLCTHFALRHIRQVPQFNRKDNYLRWKGRKALPMLLDSALFKANQSLTDEGKQLFVKNIRNPEEEMAFNELKRAWESKLERELQ